MNKKELDEKIQLLREQKQQEAVKTIVANNYRGLVDIVMRYGKTKIGIDTIDRFNNERKTSYISLAKSITGIAPKVLWVTPSRQLRDKDIPNEFKKFGKEDLLDLTKIVCWTSLHKEEGHYDLIIFDEYQCITIDSVKNIYNGKLIADHAIGLTGTPPKDYAKNYILGKLKLETIITITIDEAIEDNVVSDYRITVIKFDLDKSDYYIPDSLGNKITERTQYENITKVIDAMKANHQDVSRIAGVRRINIYNSKNRMIALNKLKNYLDSKSKRGLIFTPFKKIAEKFINYFHSTSTSIHYSAFQEGKINSLALVKSGSVGHTYENIEYVVVSSPTQDKAGGTTQSWGRGLLYKEGVPLDIYFLCAKDTVEETNWLPKTLSKLDPAKIQYTTIEELIWK